MTEVLTDDYSVETDGDYLLAMTVDGVLSRRDNFGFGGYFYNFRDDDDQCGRNDVCLHNSASIAGGYRHCHDGTEMCEHCWLTEGHRIFAHSTGFCNEMTLKFGREWWNDGRLWNTKKATEGRFA